MMKKLITLSVAAGLAAGAVMAQSPGTGSMPGPPDPQTMIQMRVSFLATLLNLTDAQKSSATTIFTNAYTASQSVRSSLETNRQSLADAVKKNDTTTIDSLSATIGNLTGQLTAIESKAEAALYAILTADQQTKYDALPHGGPGGFGGPGRRVAPGRFRPPQ